MNRSKTYATSRQKTGGMEMHVVIPLVSLQRPANHFRVICCPSGEPSFLLAGDIIFVRCQCCLDELSLVSDRLLCAFTLSVDWDESRVVSRHDQPSQYDEEANMRYDEAQYHQGIISERVELRISEAEDDCQYGARDVSQ